MEDPQQLQQQQATSSSSSSSGNAAAATVTVEMECRICRSGAEPGRPLYWPCGCSGSIRHVHEDCLTQWLARSKKSVCELCAKPFQFTPVYAENTPKSLPLTSFVLGLFQMASSHLSFTVRVLFTLFLWLLIIPISTSVFWRFSFAKEGILDTLSQIFLYDVFKSVWIEGAVLCGVILAFFIALTTIREFFIADGDDEEEEGDGPPAVVVVPPPPHPHPPPAAAGAGEDAHQQQQLQRELEGGGAGVALGGGGGGGGGNQPQPRMRGFPGLWMMGDNNNNNNNRGVAAAVNNNGNNNAGGAAAAAPVAPPPVAGGVPPPPAPPAPPAGVVDRAAQEEADRRMAQDLQNELIADEMGGFEDLLGFAAPIRVQMIKGMYIIMANSVVIAVAILIPYCFGRIAIYLYYFCLAMMWRFATFSLGIQRDALQAIANAGKGLGMVANLQILTARFNLQFVTQLERMMAAGPAGFQVFSEVGFSALAGGAAAAAQQQQVEGGGGGGMLGAEAVLAAAAAATTSENFDPAVLAAAVASSSAAAASEPSTVLEIVTGVLAGYAAIVWILLGVVIINVFTGKWNAESAVIQDLHRFIRGCFTLFNLVSTVVVYFILRPIICGIAIDLLCAPLRGSFDSPLFTQSSLILALVMRFPYGYAFMICFRFIMALLAAVVRHGLIPGARDNAIQIRVSEPFGALMRGFATWLFILFPMLLSILVLPFHLLHIFIPSLFPLKDSGFFLITVPPVIIGWMTRGVCKNAIKRWVRAVGGWLSLDDFLIEEPFPRIDPSHEGVDPVQVQRNKPYFRLRLSILIILGWITIFSFTTLFFLSSLIIGRSLVSPFAVRFPPLEFYSMFVGGFGSLGIIASLVSLNARIREHGREQIIAFFNEVGKSARELILVLALGMFVIPYLAGSLVQLCLVWGTSLDTSPFSTYMDNCILGIFAIKLWETFSSLFPSVTFRWAERKQQHKFDWQRLDCGPLLTEILIPEAITLLVPLTLPHVIFRGLLPRLLGVDAILCFQIFRLTFPFLGILCVLAFVVAAIRSVLTSAHDTIRNQMFLVGHRLNNAEAINDNNNDNNN